MNKYVVAAAAAALLSVAPAKAHQTVVYAPGPVAQGHPYLVKYKGVITIYPVPPRPLQYGWIEGRRVLVDSLTMRVVYYLEP